MQVGIMITNGGPHPAFKLAQMTVDQLVQINDGASEEARLAGESLRGMMALVLEKHHGMFQLDQRKKLKEDPALLSGKVTQVSNAVEEALKELLTVVADTPFADHFAKADIQEYVRGVVTRLFNINADIERSWFADRNPDLPEAKTFKQVRAAREQDIHPER